MGDMASFLDRLTGWATGRRARQGALIELALTLKGKGQLVEAAAWCERVLRSDRDNGEALLLSAEIAAARGERESAAGALARLQALEPHSAKTAERMSAAFRRAGKPELAVAALEPALRRAPKSAALLCELGDAEAALGHGDAALAAYDGALAARPGKSRTATQRALFLLRRDWGPPPGAPPDKRQAAQAGGRIMSSQLGLRGRFGTQLAHYMAVRLCGETYGLSVEVPAWIGRWLFELDDPYPGAALAELSDSDTLKRRMFDGASGHIVAEHDLAGSFFVHTASYAPHRAFIETLFRPGERTRAALDPALARLRQKGATVIALHLGRGEERGRSIGPSPGRSPGSIRCGLWRSARCSISPANMTMPRSSSAMRRCARPISAWAFRARRSSPISMSLRRPITSRAPASRASSRAC